MQKNIFIQKKMPWKHKFVLLGLMVLVSLLMVYAFDDQVQIIKGILFSWVLIIASYHDLETRIIPNHIHVLILLIGLFDVSIFDALIGLILVPMPFFIFACMKEGSFGGGDIKLIGACAFLLGLQSAFVGIVTSLIIAISFNILGREKYFAFVPYISVGMILAMIIGK